MSPTDATETEGDVQSQESNVMCLLTNQPVSLVPNIADQYSGLLDALSPGQRRGLIAKLSNGYYDGWRPTRAQLIDYIRNQFGITATGSRPHG
jgi:hypothetical protein